MKFTPLTIISLLALSCALAFAAPVSPWLPEHWVIKDKIGDASNPDLDLCNVFYREEAGRYFIKATVVAELNPASLRLQLSDAKSQSAIISADTPLAYRGVYEQSGQLSASPTILSVQLLDDQGNVADSASVNLRNHRSLDNETGNCAFVHHGNQGLTYTSVFRGDGGSPTEGFDEILELHQARSVPGNFHMSGTLISAAEWYDPAFNQWLRDGIAADYVAMLTSAYAQHIMPFVTDAMNNWAVNIEHDMIQTIYGYNARVAWVPERVWLADCCYPNAHLIDNWLGDNWQQHGVDAVILDDWPHVAGQSDRKIHWMNNNSGVTLRVIPIDGEFTGNCHYNPAAAIAQIQATGQYGIIVYGTDWEAASEMADFNCPDCLENYSQVVNWAADNYPAVGVWKLDAALDNPDFNGWGINVGNGTYGLIGGDQGYGGSNNSWYGDWAGTASHSDYHTPTPWNYGQVWTTTYNNLISAPVNNLSESAWYVLMTNLHETAWHDFMGGPISGWEHRYSSHIKNANVYAEAARWAAGLYAIPVNAFLSDIDADGNNELILHNERIYTVFEANGGRAQWIFAKDSAGTLYNYSVVGSCNTYWNETDGDYDEPSSNNHQAAFSEVSPNYRNDLYSFAIDAVTSTSATIRLTHESVTKVLRVDSQQPYVQANYDVGPQNCYIRHGFTPDLIDQIWNADMQRIYAPSVSYTGFRDPHTGATGAIVYNNGGASHVLEFGGTILRGDEIRGYDRFGYLLFAGATSAPDSQGRVPELEALHTLNLDHFAPRMNAQAVFINANTIELTFTEAVDLNSAQNPANWSLSGFAGSYSVTAATRQNDWSHVRLTITPNLAGGDHGVIAVTALIQDLNNNPVDSLYDTASLAVPNGLTPHTIVIDGIKDFDLANECLFAGSDTLVLTWDSLALYVGLWNRDLNTGDLFIHIDTNQLNNSGALTGSWGREQFNNPFRIEYQVAIEGGPDNISLNRWNGSAWTFQSFGVHTCTSYNGWASNPFTEIRIPWNQIGNPIGIALAASFTAENSSQTLRAFPTTNPIGNFVTISQFYRLYSPYITGSLPLFGVRPKNILSGDLAAPSAVTIQAIAAGRQLNWPSVPAATSYSVYRAADFAGPFQQIANVSTNAYLDSETLPGIRYMYRITAIGGL